MNVLVLACLALFAAPMAGAADTAHMATEESSPTQVCPVDRLAALAFRRPKSDRTVVRIEAQTEVSFKMRDAVQLADTALAKGEIPHGDPEAYRNRLQEEFAKLRAQQRTDAEIARRAVQGTNARNTPDDPTAISRRRAAIYNEELANARRETVLFLDTPQMDSNNGLMNRPGVPLVIDHHMGYGAQVGPHDNTGAQVIGRLSKAAAANMKDGRVDVDAAMKQFNRDLYGTAERVILATDNLADSAEVMAILRSPELQRRILSDPKVAEMLTVAGQYTDFHVFLGDQFEARNPQHRAAVQLSKSIMDSHSAILGKYGVTTGDRIVGLSVEKQRTIALEAARAAEKLLLEATDPGGGLKTAVPEGAARFDRWRGGPTALVRSNGSPTSFGSATTAHQEFQKQLTGSLRQAMQEEGATVRDEKQERELAQALDGAMFGHGSVRTGNLFADWAASPMANHYTKDPQGRRPFKLELGGASASDVGKMVIIGKSGPVEEKVDVNPYLQALNAANDSAKARMRQKLEAQGMAPKEIEAQLGKVTSFVGRGNELAFNFGGHALTQAEVQLTLARVAAQQSKPR